MFLSMFTYGQQMLTDDNFDEAINGRSAFQDDNISVIVVEFWASFNDANSFSDWENLKGIKYYKVDISKSPKAKKEYKVKLKDADKDFVFDETEADLNKFDKIIDEIEPGALRLPVLLKKYIKQNAKLLAFNVDPLFNNAVDGLMYIKIADLPESTVRPVMEEFQAELERKFLENNGD